MAKLNIYHLFATAVVLRRSRHQIKEKKIKKEGLQIFFIIGVLKNFVHFTGNTCVFKNERNRKTKKFGLVRMSPNRFDHLLEIIKPMIMKKNAVRTSTPPDEYNSIMMNDFHHLLRSLVRFSKVLSKW